MLSWAQVKNSAAHACLPDWTLANKPRGGIAATLECAKSYEALGMLASCLVVSEIFERSAPSYVNILQVLVRKIRELQDLLNERRCLSCEHCFHAAGL